MLNSNAFGESYNSRDKASSADMPQALCRLVKSIDTIAGGAEAPGGRNEKGAETPNDGPPPFPATTMELLRQVDELYETYTRLVEVVCRSLMTTASPTGGVFAETEQVDGILVELRKSVGKLQAGIRSKIHQTGRFALLNHLSSEVQKRQVAVKTMESVLATTKRHM